MQFVTLKGDDWFKKQKIAGKVVARCLKTSKDLIEKETPNLTLKDIEAECIKIIEDANCTPTFKGYRGFPGAICTSVNRDVVHGIPSDYVVQPGDVVKVDLGATFEGVIADAAISAIYGEPKNKEHVELLKVCREALHKGISAIKVGRQLGCIGHAIHKHTKYSPFHLITEYGGHGISWEAPHSQPFVANKDRYDSGIRIQPGLTIAIEPMLVIGSNKTTKQKDGWTIRGKGIGAHAEHTIFVDEDKVHIMTDWESLNDD